MKKLFLTILIMSIFLIGFSASSSDSGKKTGTYKISGGYTLVIDEDDAVRLTNPNGKVFTGHIDDWGSLLDYTPISFTEKVEINGFYGWYFYIDKDFHFIYDDSDNLQAKDERHRIKIEKSK